jgi:hypothetical protein
MIECIIEHNGLNNRPNKYPLRQAHPMALPESMTFDIIQENLEKGAIPVRNGSLSPLLE